MELEASTSDNRQKTFWRNPPEQYDLPKVFKEWKHIIKNILEIETEELPSNLYGYKFQLDLQVTLRKYSYKDNGEIESVQEVDPHFLSQSYRYDDESYNEDLKKMYNEIENAFDAFISSGSGWHLHKISKQKLKLYRFRKLIGGTRIMALPPFVRHKRACVSVKCDDEKCFLYCCLMGVYDLYRTRHVPSRKMFNCYSKHFNTSCLTWPVTLSQIPKFESLNSVLSINVFSLEGKETIVPIYHTKNKQKANQKCVNLLLYKEHFYLIKSLSRLLCSQLSSRNKKFYCHYCLSSFWKKESLDMHNIICQKKEQLLTLPPMEKSTIFFDKFAHMFPLAFSIYYDIEVLLVNKDDSKEHIPISVCSYTHCVEETYSQPPVVFTGLDCVEEFLDHLKLEGSRIKCVLDEVYEPISANEEDMKRYHSATKCEICGQKFSNTITKYMDHNHLIPPSKGSNFRYVTCNTCNLIHGKRIFKIPVIAHNAMKYDINHVIKKIKGKDRISVIARNSEQFISVKWLKCFYFIDSLNFLQGSLDSLSEKLSEKDVTPFLNVITKQRDLQEMLRHKTPFPYDFLDGEEKLKVNKLPSRKYFFNTLTSSHITKEQYERALNIWEKFECKNFQEYMELYVTLDVMLLAAVFETYRVSSIKHFGIDPAFYVSSPSLCYSAMLKYTGITLETVPTTEMYLFFTKAIRGGLCGTSQRYATANNDLMENYDTSKPISHIVGFDANNLYGHSLSQYLPIGDFHWLSSKEIQEFDVTKVGKKSNVGYFLQVDMKYPSYLHDAHNHLPLAPEKIEIQPSEWSQYTRLVAKSLNEKEKSGGIKLLTTLHDKKNYILYYETLKLYLKLGLVVTKIHRILRFKQSPFLEKFIELNNNARKKATSDFEISLYKLYNNSIYGKMMYNVFKKVDLKLVNSRNSFEKLVAKPNFSTSHIISDDLSCVAMKPFKVVCDKPIYVGATVLDLSKVHMYSFWYNYLLRKYSENNISMLYTDTDSFYFHLQNRPEFYKDMEEYEQFFDCSSYPPHHFLYSTKGKKVVGLMKDIHSGMPVKKFCALRSKMYAVETEMSLDLKAKGLQRNVISNLTLNTYEKCLRDIEITCHTYNTIHRKHHKLTTEKKKKMA